MLAITISLLDITCGNCMRHVRAALATLPGVSVTNVDLRRHTASIVIADGAEKLDVSAARAALDEAGYPGVVVENGDD